MRNTATRKPDPALTIPCPTCKRPAGEPCSTSAGPDAVFAHARRQFAGRENKES